MIHDVAFEALDYVVRGINSKSILPKNIYLSDNNKYILDVSGRVIGIVHYCKRKYYRNSSAFDAFDYYSAFDGTEGHLYVQVLNREGSALKEDHIIVDWKDSKADYSIGVKKLKHYYPKSTIKEMYGVEEVKETDVF